MVLGGVRRWGLVKEGKESKVREECAKVFFASISCMFSCIADWEPEIWECCWIEIRVEQTLFSRSLGPNSPVYECFNIIDIADLYHFCNTYQYNICRCQKVTGRKAREAK